MFSNRKQVLKEFSRKACAILVLTSSSISIQTRVEVSANMRIQLVSYSLALHGFLGLLKRKPKLLCLFFTDFLFGYFTFWDKTKVKGEGGLGWWHTER